MKYSPLSIDGLQLIFPGTGLALTTAEWIRALSQKVELTVFLARGVDLATFGLEDTNVRWIWLDRPTAKIDYVFRYQWGQKVTTQRKALGLKGRHFIPYLYNYGCMQENVVFVPDLVYRIFPDYGRRDPKKPWWYLRGRLPFRPAVMWIEEWIVARSKRIVTSTQFVRGHVVSALGVDPNSITVVGHATPRWISEATMAGPIHRELETRLPQNFCLYVGGYAVRKNIPMLLRVCGAVYNQDASFRCAFVGLSEERILSNQDMASVWNDPSVQKAVVCLPKVANNELRELYHRSRFTVYPSHSEGFGLPVVEAACCERMCLCGNNSSMCEIQVNPDFRVASSDEDAWVTKILEFWQNPEKTMAAGKECQQAMAHYSWEASAQRILDVAAQ